MALDVESFIGQHGLVRPTLIGHSMGAKTALTLALHSPKLVYNVVAVDNCPINLPIGPDFLTYLEGMAKVEQHTVRTHAEADEIIRQFELDPPVRLWLLSNFVKENGSPYLRLRVPLDILKKAMGPLGDFPYNSGNVTFQGPTLFLRALQSNYIPQSSFPLISHFFPQSEIVDMDCGHWIVQDRPKQFQEEVVRFLQKY
ncbi:Abhydrolase domain-containing protein C22H12.03 [Penicillium subrubescens]|uniref:Abhydrolase domain-containing protein C22H12.03 n=2 Tax=Penicillium subrubescens TaxID=1316194 RepID=A0A1Q5U4I0_9EURO|nr:Abhydrolase domain-containing protein C22H12.03 [Penicillium subrubescens]